MIELIIYVALISIFISAAILFAWDIIYGRIKSQIYQDINQNLRFVSQRIASEIRNASGINAVNSNSISLSSHDVNRNPTVIDLNNNQIRIGYGNSGSCSISSPCSLSSNQLSVTQLLFENLSTVDNKSKHIRYMLTINSNSDRKEWQRTKTVTASAELRSN